MVSQSTKNIMQELNDIAKQLQEIYEKCCEIENKEEYTLKEGEFKDGQNN